MISGATFIPQTRAERQIVTAAKRFEFEIEGLQYDSTYRDWHIQFVGGDWLLIDSAAVAEAEFARHRHYLESGRTR